jgi:hypothetical protein
MTPNDSEPLTEPSVCCTKRRTLEERQKPGYTPQQ